MKVAIQGECLAALWKGASLQEALALPAYRGTAAGAASLGSSAKAPCSFCPAEATPAEGTGHAEAGARGARSAVHQRVRALVLLVLLVLVCHCPCPYGQGQ